MDKIFVCLILSSEIIITILTEAKIKTQNIYISQRRGTLLLWVDLQYMLFMLAHSISYKNSYFVV